MVWVLALKAALGGVMMMLYVRVKSTAMAVRIGVRMNVCERRLQKGSAEDTRQEEAKEWSHQTRTNILIPILPFAAFGSPTPFGRRRREVKGQQRDRGFIDSHRVHFCVFKAARTPRAISCAGPLPQ